MKLKDQPVEIHTKKIKKDIIVLVGDLNTQIASNNEGLEMIIGKHGLEMMNDNS